MNNYEYIIASLPVLQKDAGNASVAPDTDSLIEEIKSSLEEGDAAKLELLLKGFDSESLNEDFYREALKSRSEFIRSYFGYDLMVRNTRTIWLNKSLGRDWNMDTIILGEDEDDPIDIQAVNNVLSQSDIVDRERDLDSLMWKRIEEINVLKVFDLDVILGFVAQLKIVDRWIKLDPQTGRELFRKLVEEIRSSRTKQ